MNNIEQSPPIVEPIVKPDNTKKSKPIQIPTSKWVQKGCEEHPYKHLM